jgi:signal transduction histidine kinase
MLLRSIGCWPGKTIIVRCQVVDHGESQKLVIVVEDNGIGMTEAVRQKAKDAFYSTKPSSEGTGLGLSIVNEIVVKHKGQLNIESQSEEYTRVQVLLPIN